MKSQEDKRYEVDLYQPVKDYFVQRGIRGVWGSKSL